jgi:hypothetical protein
MANRVVTPDNPEYHISLTPVKVEGYTQWHVNITALRGGSDRAVLTDTSVPFLYPNAVDLIRKIIGHEGSPRFG